MNREVCRIQVGRFATRMASQMRRVWRRRCDASRLSLFPGNFLLETWPGLEVRPPGFPCFSLCTFQYFHFHSQPPGISPWGHFSLLASPAVNGRLRSILGLDDIEAGVGVFGLCRPRSRCPRYARAAFCARHPFMTPFDASTSKWL